MHASRGQGEMFVERLWKEKETSAFWKNKTNYLFSKTFSIYSYPKKPSGTPRGLVHNHIPTQSSLFQKKKKHYNPESFCHPLFPPITLSSPDTSPSSNSTTHSPPTQTPTPSNTPSNPSTRPPWPSSPPPVAGA